MLTGSQVTTPAPPPLQSLLAPLYVTMALYFLGWAIAAAVDSRVANYVKTLHYRIEDVKALTCYAIDTSTCFASISIPILGILLLPKKAEPWAPTVYGLSLAAGIIAFGIAIRCGPLRYRTVGPLPSIALTGFAINSLMIVGVVLDHALEG